ncbi:MAG: asparaginase [Gammaproteobacteria bacterium]|nr:MAG: asparaginase [Gammaproteobacteria bacterium]
MQIDIFTTGGTIDKIYFDDKSDYQVGQPVIGDLLKREKVAFDFTVTSLMKKDSLHMDDADRNTVREAVAGCSANHVLITHGTDGMVNTAKALRGIADKTIVLTGSLSPAAFQHSDAIFNIGCAIGAVQAMPPGVYIAMNGKVFAADKVRKNVEANRFEAL